MTFYFVLFVFLQKYYCKIESYTIVVSIKLVQITIKI